MGYVIAVARNARAASKEARSGLGGASPWPFVTRFSEVARVYHRRLDGYAAQRPALHQATCTLSGNSRASSSRSSNSATLTRRSASDNGVRQRPRKLDFGKIDGACTTPRSAPRGSVPRVSRRRGQEPACVVKVTATEFVKCLTVTLAERVCG